MNFPSQRIDHGYFKVLVVAETLVAEVLGEHSAVLDRFNVGVELNFLLPMRTMRPNPAFRDWFRNEAGNCLIESLHQR